MTKKVIPRIVRAEAGDLNSVRALFAAYAAGLGVDLGPQGFENEIAGLPGPYGPPRGAILLAMDSSDTPVGCIALRALGQRTAEIKRLYVTPAARGEGLGKRLIEAVLTEARARGYCEIKLDTLPQMKEAIALYERLGFERIAPYGSFPYPGLVCFGKEVR